MTAPEPTPGRAGRPAPRAGALRIAPYVAGRAWVSGGARMVKLSSNESALGASPAAVGAYGAASEELFRYPDPAATELRAAIAEVHGLDADRIVCGDGSDELLHLLALGYAGPGDEVLHSAHGFVVYPMTAHAVGATPRAVPEKEFSVDVDAMLAAVSPVTRIVFVANPNSTGTVLRGEDLHRLHDGLPTDVLLVIDAAYAEFCDVPGYDAGAALARETENSVMTRTFSKAYGLAGLRLGWCYAPRAVTEVLNRLRGPFNVTRPAQVAGTAAVRDGPFLKTVQDHNARWRPWLAQELEKLGLQVVPSGANFILTRILGGVAQADAALAHLATDGILVRDMKAYDLGDCLRITVGRESELNALLGSLGAFLGART
jgi:histidinol-phosphate aminotransferase